MTNFRVEKLTRYHAVNGFDCGEEALNRFLIRFALPNQQANATRTYVGLADDIVIGFYTLVVGEVAYDDAPDRMKKGLARYPVPIMLLARLAVRMSWQGRSTGSGLLRNAMQRTLEAADIAGIRAFVTHAKNDRAVAFYQHFNFMSSPTDPFHLYILVKDLRFIVDQKF